jgi:hypothetical protein
VQEVAIDPPLRQRATTWRLFGGDPQHSRFGSHAMALRGQLHDRFGVQLSPRQLDRILLALSATA